MTTLLVDLETRRRLNEVTRALAGEFPNLAAEDVERTVTDVAGGLSRDARFTDFLPVLAYRLARDTLVTLHEHAASAADVAA